MVFTAVKLDDSALVFASPEFRNDEDFLSSINKNLNWYNFKNIFIKVILIYILL